MNERWLCVEEIAAHLGVNPDTVYKWIERKKMPAHKVASIKTLRLRHRQSKIQNPQSKIP
jgi:excisionase family DNA binding protein